MSRAVRNLLAGRVTLFVIGVSLLLYLGYPYLVSAQVGPTSTPIPRPTATLVVTPAPTQPQPTSTPTAVTYTDLVEHFERVSSLAFTFVGTIATLLGVVGVIAGYFSLKTVGDLHKIKSEAKSEAEQLRTKIKELEKELNETQRINRRATNQLRYFLEIRERNSQVRVRAVQQLGASNDIAAVSILVEVLETDLDENVKMEAAYGLGQLLVGGEEPEALREGVKALLQGTEDDSEKVRVETIEALDTLVCNNIQLPRSVYRRLQQVAKLDKIEEVIKAAQETLEHLKQQREKPLNSQDE